MTALTVGSFSCWPIKRKRDESPPAPRSTTIAVLREVHQRFQVSAHKDSLPIREVAHETEY
jgi:hypothetical protein